MTQYCDAQQANPFSFRSKQNKKCRSVAYLLVREFCREGLPFFALVPSKTRSSPMFCCRNKFLTKHGNDILRRTIGKSQSPALKRRASEKRDPKAYKRTSRGRVTQYCDAQQTNPFSFRSKQNKKCRSVAYLLVRELRHDEVMRRLWTKIKLSVRRRRYYSNRRLHR